MQVDFYHLTAAPVDRVLPQIADKVVSSGARLLIVAAGADQRAHLDRLLWTYQPDSFLPHAQAGMADDAAQPVLIAERPEPTNGARNVAIVDGTWRDAALAFDRAFHLFGEDHITAARAAWRALAGRPDVERRYWRQSDSGRWERDV